MSAVRLERAKRLTADVLLTYGESQHALYAGYTDRRRT